MTEYIKNKELDYQKIGSKIRARRVAMSGRYDEIGSSDGLPLVLTDENPENKPFTQSMLLDYLRQIGRPHFGRNTLSKVENGDPEAFNGITINQWLALCEVFGVSLGWLLGEYDDCDTIDGQWIHEKTGLSGKAVKTLLQSHKEHPGLNPFIYTLSRMLERKSGKDLLLGIWRFFLKSGKNPKVKKKIEGKNVINTEIDVGYMPSNYDIGVAIAEHYFHAFLDDFPKGK